MQLSEERADLHHSEFWPLINPRIHSFAGRSAIVCPELRTKWHSFLSCCCRMKKLGRQHLLQVRCLPRVAPSTCLLQATSECCILFLLAVAEDLQSETACRCVQAAYYLTSMDRLPEAASVMQHMLLRPSADAAESAENMQQDYLQAYLLLACPTPCWAEARALVGRHSGHTHKRWAKKWADMAAYIDQAQTSHCSNAEGDSTASPREDFLTVDSSNAANGRLLVLSNPSQGAVLQVALHRINVEMLFSNSPFASDGQGVGSTLFVQPHLSQEVPVSVDGATEIVLADTLPGEPP